MLTDRRQKRGEEINKMHYKMSNFYLGKQELFKWPKLKLHTNDKIETLSMTE